MYCHSEFTVKPKVRKCPIITKSGRLDLLIENQVILKIIDKFFCMAVLHQ